MNETVSTTSAKDVKHKATTAPLRATKFAAFITGLGLGIALTLSIMTFTIMTFKLVETWG